MAPKNTEFLHDANVSEIGIHIDACGNRQLRIRMQCDSDCGYNDWNGQFVDVLFGNPVVVLGELFGHMANAESFDSWNDCTSDRMMDRVEKLVDAGLPKPKYIAELVFHSGSVVEVACDEIEILADLG